VGTGARVASLLALAALAGAGCAPAAADGAATAPPFVYVASGGDGTIARLDAGSGRLVGAAVSVGGAPRQVAAGRAGSDERLLVLRTDGDGASALTLVVQVGNGWAERPIVVEPGALPSLVRSDGRRRAAVVYAPGPAGPGAARPPCRIAL
jgi:DNA-binding beta-propeller fold protein YncE